jgi:hypothetical protein
MERYLLSISFARHNQIAPRAHVSSQEELDQTATAPRQPVTASGAGAGAEDEVRTLQRSGPLE